MDNHAMATHAPDLPRPDDEDDTSPRTPRGIQSVEVGGQLLKVLARTGRRMALKDLARAADMTAAKAHPYLVSFGKLGLIEQDAVSGHYGLGPLAMQLGLISLQQVDPVRLAIAELPALAAEGFAGALDEPAFAAELDAVRTQQVAQVTDQLLPGISALATPVFDGFGQLVLCLAVIGPSATLQTGPASSAAQHLREAARGLSQRLGAHPASP